MRRPLPNPLLFYEYGRLLMIALIERLTADFHAVLANVDDED